VNQEIQDLLET
jgi:hypothetical protein